MSSIANKCCTQNECKSLSITPNFYSMPSKSQAIQWGLAGEEKCIPVEVILLIADFLLGPGKCLDEIMVLSGRTLLYMNYQWL